jgi:hypothetical protein
MPTCPHCRTEQTKRVGGKCPSCKTPVDVYNGRWFESGTKSPSITVLHYFEDLVSKALSNGRSTPVIFSVPVKGLSYRRELAAAAELIELSDYDLSLVRETLDILFSDKRFNWKTRQTLMWITKDFVVALAIAKSNREAAQKAKDSETDVLRRVMSREDVFS